MANELKSYVQKYIFNNESSVHVGEVGNEESQAHIEEGEGTRGEVFLSKLRSQNVSKLADRNKKYKDKKVSKNKLSSKCKDDETTYDPELSKLFIVSKSEEEDNEEQSDLDHGDFDSSPRGLKVSERDDEFSEDENDDYDEEGESEDDASEFENEEEDEEEDEFMKIQMPAMQTFNQDNDDYNQKALAVKNQFNFGDSLFEMRIGLQKALTNSNRLPQHDNFKRFRAVDLDYKKSLQKARSEAKKLLSQLITLQDEILGENVKTKSILEAASFDSIMGEASNEDEELNNHRKTKKRKVEQFENLLSDRHEAFVPFRDDTLTTWHERSQMMRQNKSSSNFSGFESSAVKQLEDVLSNYDQLVKRTQLISVERGNQMDILGKRKAEDGEKLRNYDPEIFDDTDFYTQQLEHVLKSKMSSDSNNTNMAQSLANVLALRRRTRKKVIPRSSKLRSLRYEVMSLLQNYLAPCKHPTLSDDASDKLFSSLFGQSLVVNKSVENKIA